MNRLRRILQLGKGTRWRWGAILVLLYVGAVATGNGAILMGVATARVAGADPLLDLLGLPEIKHLRQIDHHVWAGAGPSTTDLRGLADLGITTVVDLREGIPGDVRGSERVAAAVGLEYFSLPLPDGQVLEHLELERLMRIVDEAEGDVFINCGGGVGRTTSTTAAYEAAVGRDPSLLPRIAIGPMSFEQAWFIVSADPDNPAPDHPIVEAVSRYVIDAPRKIVNWVETLI